MSLQTPELEIAIEEPRAWARRLTITVPAERVRTERESEIKKLSRQVRLPGFRKGRVPPQIVERQYGSLIDQQMMDRLINEAYKEAIDREQLQPISQGEIDDVDFQPDGPLTFAVEFEVRPEIELERIGGFTLEKKEIEIGEDEIDAVIERLRQQNAEWHTVEEGKPEDGDRVIVEITPLEGVEAERGAEPRQYELIIGENQALPPVEGAIRTLGVGETEEFDLELPDPDSEEEDATREEKLRITLVEISRAELPEANDELAQKVGEFESLEELSERIRADLVDNAERDAERELRRELLDKIIEANEFEVPETMINRYLEQLFPAREDEDAEERAEMLQMARPSAETALRRMMVVERIAELEGLHATSAEVDDRVEEIAEVNDRPVAEVWTELQRSGRMATIEEEITEDKVFEYLKALSTIE